MANRVAAIHEARELCERVQAVLMGALFADTGTHTRALVFKTRLRSLLAEYEQPVPPAPEPEEDTLD